MLDNGTRSDSVRAVGLIGPRGPGRWLYLLAGAIFAGGLALGVVLAIQASISLATQFPTDATPRMLAPGSTDLVLAQPGTYNVFYEYESTFQGMTYEDSSAVPSFTVTLQSKTSGTTLSMQDPHGTSTYRTGNTAGEEIGLFNVDRAGTYTLVASYPDMAYGTQVVLALVHPTPLSPFDGPVLLVAITLLLAGPITGLTVVAMRWGNRQAQLAAPPGWTGPTGVPANPASSARSTVFASPALRATVAMAAVGMAVLQRLLSAVLDDSGLVADGSVRVPLLVADTVLALGFIIAAIAIPMWCYRAYRNLGAFGAGPLTMNAAMAAAGWFIPIANVVLPYLALRVIWQNSRPAQERSTILGLYWLAWLLGGGAGVFSYAYVNGFVIRLPVVIDLALVPAGLLLILVVRRITRWQLRKNQMMASPQSAGSPAPSRLP